MGRPDGVPAVFRKLEIILAAEERMLPEENYTELAATIQKEPLLQR